jgi:hypothetical protein
MNVRWMVMKCQMNGDEMSDEWQWIVRWMVWNVWMEVRNIKWMRECGKTDKDDM